MEDFSNNATAAATKSPKAALSGLPEVINFHHTGIGLHLGKFVWFMLYRWIKTQRSYPSVPFEKKIDLEQQSEKKLNDLNSFNNSVNYIKELIPYFKEKNHWSKKKQKNKMLTLLKSCYNRYYRHNNEFYYVES